MKRRRLQSVVLLALCASTVASAQARDIPLVWGDRVLLKLWADTVFADTARVQERGVVILPRIGPVSVANVPASQLADSIRRAYAVVFRALTVEVTPLRKVTVLGEVLQPGVYYLERTFRVREAIAMAGGVTEIGKTNRATLIRDSATVRLRNWAAATDERSVLRSGDIVIADREPWIKRNVFSVLSGISVVVSIALSLSR